MGCEPEALEAAAPVCDALAAVLRRSQRHLAAAADVQWHGPGARRCRVALARLAPALRVGAATVEHLARRLRAQAGAQRRASLGAPARQVLRYDRAGDGRWVEAVGAAAAPTLVVLVPGVGTDRGDRRRLSADAHRVWQELAWRAERDGTGQDGVRVVAWLGYDPPDHLLAGLSRSSAARGARTLVADLAQWRAAGAERVVVVGHSYGALVSTRASSSGAAPDELVLLGAPGSGLADASALRLPQGADLWAAAADGDPVTLLARTGLVHGPDPLPWARALPTSLPGHGAYLRDPVLVAALAELTLHDPRPAGTVAAPDPRGTPWASP
jgi:hypothetical protein